ncbi:hypothetical protein PR048_004239 [Dryococelus australis]|uniref:PID domain-containing protein n=1 Tax=Dryococelus australis TaxID=614101 RepID=A0ABQ9I507_9NEOP|nr:hypothetical protein PR048_004239 [Dryococelus australis]
MWPPAVAGPSLQCCAPPEAAATRLSNPASVACPGISLRPRVELCGSCVHYLPGEGCVEKPLSTLWKNYMGSSKADVQMKVTVTQAGLKAVTKEHGLTEYWSHRITYCAAPSSFPRVFCWVYRHEGRKLKQELRCHAVLCPKEALARDMATQLSARLAQALSEFKRDKVSRQNARLSLANSVYDNPSMPRRKILLSTGSHNYRPPLERSKSAPKLMVIEEEGEAEEQEMQEERR